MGTTPLSLRLTTTQRILLVASPLAIGFLTPPLTLLGVQTLVGGIPLGAAVADIVEKQFEDRRMLSVVSLFGLIPFLVLTAKLHAYTATRTRRACFGMWLFGLLGILALMIPTHVAVWYPHYGPGKMSSTGAIAFVIVPFYCIGTLTIGLFVGNLVTRHPWFGAYADGHCRACGYDLQGNTSGVCPECGRNTGS